MCASRQNTIYQKRAHTPSLRWLANTISEWDGKSHSQGIHFTRSHIFGGNHILLKDRIQHSGVIRLSLLHSNNIFNNIFYTNIMFGGNRTLHTHTHTYTKDRMQHRGVIRLSLLHSNNLSYSKQHVTAQKQSYSFQTILLSSKSGLRSWVIMLCTK